MREHVRKRRHFTHPGGYSGLRVRCDLDRDRGRTHVVSSPLEAKDSGNEASEHPWMWSQPGGDVSNNGWIDVLR
ncbi:hypothetical protein [Ktedonobacter sp. SOSP1-52]|uniref:hypothetical protein n=1 Tax=Ktedonobacter sp. SOSP1-52 TaxID=2778366 RepID=UPI001915BA7B|nr:hypothetical protein [Ktedonobacter sp. SOSP1-52]